MNFEPLNLSFVFDFVLNIRFINHLLGHCMKQDCDCLKGNADEISGLLSCFLDVFIFRKYKLKNDRPLYWYQYDLGASSFYIFIFILRVTIFLGKETFTSIKVYKISLKFIYKLSFDVFL